MQVLRTEYFDCNLYRWVGFFETVPKNLDKARKCLKSPKIESPYIRLVICEKSCGKKRNYYKLLKIMEVSHNV
ncbi:hypothetical protein SAMN04487977_101542 [Treponema bryantii]|uniref:Uncharacterized protein n=1 Tax=Treponema bryantii TaxID=163 RepID=A0A1H9B251_9SPIR|nr:hypothetical protein SAMN04487977_101542 [Treponema bryantii]